MRMLATSSLNWRTIRQVGAGRAAGSALLLLILGLTNCIGVPGGRATGSKGHPSRRGIEEYFVGPGVLQYFLLPQRLAGPGRQYADLDLTVRDSASRPLWGLLHVSFVGPAALTPADTVLLSTVAGPQPLAPARVMFTEVADKRQQQLTRLEWHLTAAQVTAYLSAPEPALLLRAASAATRMRFAPEKKARARLQAFREVTLGGG